MAFDLSEDNVPEKDYFYIPSAFSMDWALKPLGGKSAARSRSEFKRLLKKRGISIKLFAPGEYKSDLLVRLGIYDDHFFQVFRTAVAYVPLDKIEDFIVKNICHMEDNIDVPKMKAAIHDYQRMQRDMADFQERQRELEELKSIYDEFSSRLETYSGQEYIVRRAKVDRLREEQRAAEQEMIRLENEKEQCEREDEEIEALSQEKQQLHVELLQRINEDPATREREEKAALIDTCTAKISERERERDNQLNLLGQRLSAWSHRLTEVSHSHAGKVLGREKVNELSQALNLFGQYTLETFIRMDPLKLEEANGRLEALRNDVLSLQTGWRNLRTEAKRRVEEYRAQLEELKKGVKSYPKDLLALRGFLQDTLSERHGCGVQVSILADLISITDPAWVNVTEGYLRRQKLYLLTEPEYHREAVRLLKTYSREKGCYRYRVVNTGSVVAQRAEVRDNSLAKLIATEHPAARSYVDYLLGRVERVDNIETVGGKRTAVTVDGMLYQAFATARMNEADWRMRYIGQDSIAQQMAETERLLAEERSQIADLNQKIAPLEPWTTEKTLSDEFLENLAHAVTGVQELPSLESELDELWKQLQKIDDSYVKSLKRQAEELRQELNALVLKGKELSKKIGELSSQHTMYYHQAGAKEQAWEAENEQFTRMYPDGNEVSNRTAMRYESELLQKGSAEKVQIDFEKALLWSKGRLETLNQNFRQKVEAFNRRHVDASISTELSSDEWRSAYDEAKSVRLEEFTAQVTAARERAEEIFRNEFINQIKRNINTVSREIKLLNKALEEYTFGKIKYRFKCSPTENAEMRKYYDMITSSRLDGASIYDLLEAGTDLAEYKPMVKTLFQMISSEGTDLASRQQVEANIEKYKSFQTYLRFDLVEVGPDGKEYPLSRSMGSNSGGERQTPFYVAILASLMKTYRINQNANSLRLVVFDEAFDKIDTSRIEECINMLREIGFQSIIAAGHQSPLYCAFGGAHLGGHKAG